MVGVDCQTSCSFLSCCTDITDGRTDGRTNKHRDKQRESDEKIDGRIDSPDRDRQTVGTTNGQRRTDRGRSNRNDLND